MSLVRFGVRYLIPSLGVHGVDERLHFVDGVLSLVGILRETSIQSVVELGIQCVRDAILEIDLFNMNR